MGVFQNNLLAGAAAAASAGGGAFYSHQIEQSMRFDNASDTYLTRTPSSNGNRKTWTLSFWLKLGELASVRNDTNAVFANLNSGYGWTQFQFQNTDKIYVQLTYATSGGKYLTADRLFRDTSAWMHFVWRVDTTQASASNRQRVYLNGTELDYSTQQTIPQDSDVFWNNTTAHYIGYEPTYSNHEYEGYLAEVINIDGTSLGPDSFGETKNGVWIPKDASGLTFGTNGFHLKFENASDLGNDSSGNNNDWTVNNAGADHQVLDSPTFGS